MSVQNTIGKATGSNNEHQVQSIVRGTGQERGPPLIRRVKAESTHGLPGAAPDDSGRGQTEVAVVGEHKK